MRKLLYILSYIISFTPTIITILIMLIIQSFYAGIESNFIRNIIILFIIFSFLLSICLSIYLVISERKYFYFYKTCFNCEKIHLDNLYGYYCHEIEEYIDSPQRRVCENYKMIHFKNRIMEIYTYFLKMKNKIKIEEEKKCKELKEKGIETLK